MSPFKTSCHLWVVTPQSLLAVSVELDVTTVTMSPHQKTNLDKFVVF